MAISVKDIQEKEFATQASGGYDVDQVDDFLDELANQFAAILRENLALTGQLKQLESELSAARAENTAMEARLPDYNEGNYFKQLETAMRESLTGAQRIADKTVSEANVQAQQTIESANAKAEKTVSDANTRAQCTIDRANEKAERTLADAQLNARSITEAAEKTVSDLKGESERIRGVVNEYREHLHKMLDDQLAILRASEAQLR